MRDTGIGLRDSSLSIACGMQLATIHVLLAGICAITLSAGIASTEAGSAPNRTICGIRWLDRSDALALLVEKRVGDERRYSVTLLNLGDRTTKETLLSSGTASELDNCPGSEQLVFAHRKPPTISETQGHQPTYRYAGVEVPPEGYPWMDTDIGIWDAALGRYRLFQLPGSNHYPAYSPTAHQVAFLHNLSLLGVMAGAQSSMEHGLWVFDLDTNRLNRLSHPGLEAIEGPPRWSPGGEHIAFARKQTTIGPEAKGPPYDLWMAAIGGAPEKRLTSIGQVQPLPIEWDQDGRHVFFMREHWAGREPKWSRITRSLWLVAASGGKPKQLLSWDELHHPASMHDTSLSPGGARVAVRQQPRDGSVSAIWIIDVASKRAVCVDTSGRLGPLSWSSDGSNLAYVQGNDLCVARIAGDDVHTRLVWHIR